MSIVARGLARGPSRGALVAFGLCIALLSGGPDVVEPPQSPDGGGVFQTSQSKRRIRHDVLQEINAILSDDEDVATAMCLLLASGMLNDFDLT